MAAKGYRYEKRNGQPKAALPMYDALLHPNNQPKALGMFKYLMSSLGLDPKFVSLQERIWRRWEDEELR